MLVHPIRIFGVMLLVLSGPCSGIASGANEAVNWRVWNTDDGMIEAYVPQIKPTFNGQVVVRHGDVPVFDVIDGLRLFSLPDRPTLGRIEPDGTGDYYSFDKSGIVTLHNGVWQHDTVPEIARFSEFGVYRSFGWFDYPGALEVPSRVSSAVAGSGKLLLTFADRFVEWTRAGGIRTIRNAADGGIGDFIDVEPIRDGRFAVSGTKGLSVYRTGSDSWTAIAGPPAFSRFVFPALTGSGDLLVTADGKDGKKRLLRYSRGSWHVEYNSDTKVRGWEADGRVWLMEPDRLLTLARGSASEVNLHPFLSGRLMDAGHDGNTFWIASMQGLARYAPPLWRLPEGAPDVASTVNTIAEDAAGALWFSNGKQLIRNQGGAWTTFRLPDGEAQDAGKTESICPMDDGRIFLLTDDTRHIVEFHPADGTFRMIPHPAGRTIKWIGRQDGRSIWVQSFLPGEQTSSIEVFDGTRFATLPGAGTIPTTDVRAILRTRAGEIWIGGTGNLVRLAGGRLRVVHKSDGVAEQSGFSLVEAGDGTIYLGQRDTITAFDAHGFRVLRRGMDRVRRLAISKDGSLWAASGTGIHRFRNGSWLTNAQEEGLPSSAAYTVLADRQGRIWAGTTLGLSLYHPESDRDPPVTAIRENQNLRKAPPGGEVRLAFSGTDKWKQTPEDRLLFSWRLDEGQWSAFDKENLVAIQALRSGNHIFQVRAMDRNGNIDPHPAVFPFEVLFPWYRESGFYGVAFVLALAIGLLMRSAVTYHRNLRFQSRHDSLTSLPNRLQFEEALSAALEKPAAAVGVMFIDLDGFKAVNDSLGHLAGDKLLIEVGHRLRTRLRRGDLLARIGGDEFAILLFNAKNREAVGRFADEVLEIVRSCSPSPVSRVAASVGISIAPEHGTAAHALVRLADLAMYQSKSRSGDCSLFYESGMKVDFRGAEMAGMIRTAIREHHFVLWYQPIVNRRKEVVRMEALVRINDSELGVIPPGSFIGVAEETGQIHAIGKWVLREAARTACLWRQGGCEVPIAVNISPVQLERGELADEILDILREFALPPAAITIEITETAIARNQAHATTILKRLRAAGLSISLDDFGTGYSALNMLDGMPLDEIKLDRSFAASMASERTRDVVFQTVKLARNLNVTVVAEGIEETSQMETAMELGCDHFQGFLIAPPLEPGMATQFILHQSGHNEWDAGCSASLSRLSELGARPVAVERS